MAVRHYELPTEYYKKLFPFICVIPAKAFTLNYKVLSLTMNSTIKNGLILGSMAVVALGLKKFYQTAEVPDLQWILGPTKTLVQAFSGLSFTYDTTNGYVNLPHQFTIAKSCAGVNFLIIVFCTSVFGFTLKMKNSVRQWLSLPAFLGIAYALTVVVNAFRIISALTLGQTQWMGIDANGLHEMEGVVVYLSFLLIYYLTMHHLLHRTNTIHTYKSTATA
ncbi:MAG TPA: exosortase K [Microscillaceae bacterium]|nr:exosortase K [Microscillaceae bacterium]